MRKTDAIPAIQHITTLQRLCISMQKAIDRLYPEAQTQRLYRKMIIRKKEELEQWKEKSGKSN